MIKMTVYLKKVITLLSFSSHARHTRIITPHTLLKLGSEQSTELGIYGLDQMALHPSCLPFISFISRMFFVLLFWRNIWVNLAYLSNEACLLSIYKIIRLIFLKVCFVNISVSPDFRIFVAVIFKITYFFFSSSFTAIFKNRNLPNFLD